MFLGADYPYQRYNPGNAYFSNYLVRTYNRDHLSAKIIRVLVEDLLPPGRNDRLLDLMVARNETTESRIAEGKATQVRVITMLHAWCERNEQRNDQHP